MNGILPRRQTSGLAPAQVAPDGLAGLKPLPLWFFTFEGMMGSAFDVCHVWDRAWMLMVALAVVNGLIGLTIMRRRIKLVKAMLRNGRTRLIAFGLIGARVALHVVLGAAGVAVTGPAAHLALAVVMGGATMGLLWFDQRVTFRALGLSPAAC